MREEFCRHSKDGRSSKDISNEAESRRYLKHAEQVTIEVIEEWLENTNMDKVFLESDFRPLLASIADRISTPKDSFEAGEVASIILSALQSKIKRELDFAERMNLQLLLGEYFIRPKKE